MPFLPWIDGILSYASSEDDLTIIVWCVSYSCMWLLFSCFVSCFPKCFTAKPSLHLKLRQGPTWTGIVVHDVPAFYFASGRCFSTNVLCCGCFKIVSDFQHAEFGCSCFRFPQQLEMLFVIVENWKHSTVTCFVLVYITSISISFVCFRLREAESRDVVMYL